MIITHQCFVSRNQNLEIEIENLEIEGLAISLITRLFPNNYSVGLNNSSIHYATNIPPPSNAVSSQSVIKTF